MPPQVEVIDVDSYEPEIEVVAYRKRTFDLTEDAFTLGHVPSSSSGPSSSVLAASFARTAKRPIDAESKEGIRVKKQRVSNPPLVNIPQPSSSASSRSGCIKRKDRDIIDLREVDSDEEVRPMIIKKSRFSDSEDSDNDYPNIHAGLNINNNQNWQPLALHDDDPLLEAVGDLSVSETPRSDVRLRPKISTRDWYSSHTSQAYEGRWIWTALRNSRVLTPNYSQNPRKRHLQNELQYHTLKLSSSFREAAGIVNKIIQRSGTIAISSAAVGGQPDEEDEELSNSNQAGSLIVWDGNVHKPQGHDRDWLCSDEQMEDARRTGTDVPVFRKYFTVNDITFDPSRMMRIVSSGNDLTVRVWTCEDHTRLSDLSTPFVQLKNTISYNAVPHDLAFKPEDTVLAVTCRDAKIYIHRDLDMTHQEGTKAFLTVAPTNSCHCNGAMSWGLGGTSNYIFASSEPPGEDEYRGWHGAFDVNRLAKAYTFNAKEAGDALALDSNGEKLALFTRGSSSQHILRLYDVRRKLSQDVSTCNLERFAENDGEVTCATFSPDGIYLAAARSDNRTDIYDARSIGKGVLHVFEHTGPSRGSPGSESYGVIDAAWVESASRRLGLVTGGNDGCVRLWDVRKASSDPMNGSVIAETAFDVGGFSLGDPSKGEKPLVVGDCGGGIFIFDHKRNSGLW